MAGSLISNAVINFAVNTQIALQQITGFQSKFSSAIGQMRGVLAGFIGFQGIRGAYQSITQMVDAAEKWHVPVEKLSEFANLFATVGGSTDEAVASLEKFQNMANQLKFHSSGPLKELSAVLRTNLANKDYAGLIRAFRSQFGQLAPDAQTEVENMLGVDSVALRRILRMSDAEFAAAIERSKQFKTLTTEQGQAFKEWEIAISETKNALQQLSIPFLETLKPVLETVRNIAMWFNDLPDSVKKAAAEFLLVWAGVNAALKLTALLATIASGGTNLIAAAAVAGGYGLYKAYHADKKNPNAGELISAGKTASGLLDIKTTDDPQEAYKKIEAWRAGVFQPQLQTPLTAPMMRPAPSADPYTLDAVLKKFNLTRGNTTNRSNVTQNINIYGIENAESIVPQFRSIVEQGLTPIMGVQ